MIFVVQEHHARSLHWDFRLEIGGVLKSWAVPRGPSLDPAQKRLAVQVADHPLKHARYEGIIPEGQYGAGPVVVWDHGTGRTVGPRDPVADLAGGRLVFSLNGGMLKGSFALVRMKGPGKGKNWLLIKERDQHARPGWRTPVLLTRERAKRLSIKEPACAAR